MNRLNKSLSFSNLHELSKSTKIDNLPKYLGKKLKGKRVLPQDIVDCSAKTSAFYDCIQKKFSPTTGGNIYTFHMITL